MIHIIKKETETPNTLIYRFVKKVQQSGILKEYKKRKYNNKEKTKRQRRVSAIYREGKKKEIIKNKKLGLI